MIIRSAQIISFGKWTNQKFIFDNNFQVFVGSNETGKSTLKQFIRGILFGFDEDTDSRVNLYESESNGEFGGYLNVFANDGEYQISRIGRVNSELQVLEVNTNRYLKNPQLWLMGVLGPINLELFDQIFSFDQEQLNEITKLTRNELSNRLLRIGVVGSDKWLDFAKNMYQESQKQYGLNSPTRPINVLLSQYEKINKQIEALSKDLVNYQRIQEEINVFEGELKDWQSKIDESNQKISEYTNLMLSTPIYNEITNLNNQIQNKKASDFFDDDDNNSLVELDQRINSLKIQIETLNQELANDEKNVMAAVAPVATTNSSNVELELYRNNEANLRNLRLELANISNNQLKYEQLTTRYNQLVKTQVKLEKKYDGNVPQPIDDDVQLQLTGTNSQNPRWMIVMLFLFAIGSLVAYFKFFDPNDSRKLIAAVSAVLFFVLGGVSVFLARKENRSFDQLVEYGYPKKASIPAVLADQALIRSYDQDQELIEELDAEISDLEEEINKQLKFAQPLSDYFGQDINAQNITELIPNINRFFATVDLQFSENAGTVATEQIVNSQFNNLQNQRDNLKYQLDDLYMTVGASDEASYQQYKKQVTQKQSVSERLANLKEQISQDDIDKIEQYNGSAGLQSMINETQTDLLKMQNAKNSLQQRFSDNQAKLVRMSNDVSYQELVQNKADLETQINAEFENYLTNQLTADWIESTLQQATSERFPQIVKLAKTFFNNLTNGEYVDIILNRENILVENSGGTHYNVVQLSKGTAEQLYVAFRFAFAEIVSNVVQVPIIIDDGFVNFDDQRRQNTFNLLQELAKRHQVVYFTTNQEVINIFDSVTDMSIINEELF